jgi:hypothetical protein
MKSTRGDDKNEETEKWAKFYEREQLQDKTTTTGFLI